MWHVAHSFSMYHGSLSAGHLLSMNNSTTEHDTTELIAPFHSESTALSNDISISYYEKIPKIGKIPLCFIKILPFLQCAQNAKQFISIDSPS